MTLDISSTWYLFDPCRRALRKEEKKKKKVKRELEW